MIQNTEKETVKRVAIRLLSKGIGTLELIQSQLVKYMPVTTDHCHLQRKQMCREIVVCFKDSSIYKFSMFGRRILLTTQSTLSALTSVLAESPQNFPSPVGRDVSFDHPWTKMSISDSKTLSTLQKLNLYLEQETKIIKSGERREDDQNSGEISTDCSTTSSYRI